VCAGPYIYLGLGILLLSLPLTGKLSRRMMIATFAKMKASDERSKVPLCALL
jgi:hypothetical protein